MSLIDVTELLSDPDFVDAVQVIDRGTRVNSAGENDLDEEPYDTVGAVQPASGKVVNRLPDALRVANVMSFWIQGEITAAKPGEYSCLLVFKGRRYQVQTVFDWTAAGAGWCEGTCVAQVVAP